MQPAHGLRGAPAFSPGATHGRTPAVLPPGTIVLAMDGALPVECLNAGERIATRAGMRGIRGVETPGPQDCALEFDRPQVIDADGRQPRPGSGASAPA